jgi:tetrahydromethanopterin S-methyltransferase subunit C
MTVKVEVIEGGVPHNKIMIAGIVSTLVCLYLTQLGGVLTPGLPFLFAFFGGLAAITALIWGSHTIKVLCSYGIGTGVPSAGMIAFGSGVIAMLFATKFGILAPIVATILAGVIGLILGYTSNNILNMKIPAMLQALTEMAIIGALTLMGFAALITGGFTFQALTTSAAAPGIAAMLGLGESSLAQTFLGGCLIAVAFLLGAIAIQHPFNACLGPGWKQDRMLMLTAECGFLSMIVASIMAFALMTGPNMYCALISLIIAIIGWVFTYREYIILSKRDAAAWLDAKPIPEVEGH